MEIMESIVKFAKQLLWDSRRPFTPAVREIYFTFRRIAQVRRFGEGMRRVFGSVKLRGDQAGASGMSSFQSLATAVAAQVGTGNIAGAATAIASGGPGRDFLDVALCLFRHGDHLF